MANTKNAQKAMRQSRKRRDENRYYAKTARNAVKDIRTAEKKDEALKLLPNVLSLVDKLAKKKVIHKKKADNLKSGIMKKVNSMT